jgi:hypothetical protein
VQLIQCFYALCLKKVQQMYYARFQAFTLVSSRPSIFWVVACCSLACNWLFGTAYRSHPQRSRRSLVTNRPKVHNNPEQQRS